MSVQIIKAWAVTDQKQLVPWLSRIQSLLSTYSEAYLELCRERKQRASATCKRPLIVPVAVSGIDQWHKQQQQQQAEIDAAESAGTRTAVDAQRELLAGALSQMKYYLLDGPLAARVAVASNEAQVGSEINIACAAVRDGIVCIGT